MADENAPKRENGRLMPYVFRGVVTLLVVGVVGIFALAQNVPTRMEVVNLVEKMDEKHEKRLEKMETYMLESSKQLAGIDVKLEIILNKMENN